MRIGIVGYGKMGRFLGELLRGKHEVVFHSRHAHGAFPSLEELYMGCDVVILASSLRTLPAQIKELARIASSVPRRVTVFDVATFKDNILNHYRDFPKSVAVASVHPMFGPGAGKLRKRRFIIVPVPGREKDAKIVADFILSLGGEVSYLSPERHDRLMAQVIGIPYMLGLAYLSLSLDEGLEHFGGTSHLYLTTYGKAILHDSPDFIREVLERTEKEMQRFVKRLNSGPDVENLVKMVGEEEIENAYQRFYRVLEP